MSKYFKNIGLPIFLINSWDEIKNSFKPEGVRMYLGLHRTKHNSSIKNIFNKDEI